MRWVHRSNNQPDSVLCFVCPDLWDQIYDCEPRTGVVATTSEPVEYLSTKIGTANSLDWYYEVLNEGADAEPDPEALTGRIQGINQLVANSEFSILDTLIAQIDCNEVSDASIVAVVRATFPFKGKLKSWRQLVQNAVSSLRARERNPERLLQGVI